MKKIKSLNNNTYECWNCGVINSPMIKVHFEFIDSLTYDELNYLKEHDVEKWVKVKIEEEEWQHQITDWKYSFYCPHCLECLE